MGDYVIGIDLGGTFIKGGLVAPGGAIRRRLKRPTGVKEGYRQVLANLIAMVVELQKDTQGDNLRGIGIGVPGFLNHARGELVESPNIPGWKNFPLQAELSKKFSQPLFLENDANAAALGELWQGGAESLNSFLLITLGTGVGSGLVLDRKLWRGDLGRAGEFGHLAIEPKGLPCSCGSRGCLEVYASVKAIIRLTREVVASGKGTRLRELFADPARPIRPEVVEAAARDGDHVALEIYREVGHYLGVGISSVVNLLDIRHFLMGGAVSNALDLFLDPILREVGERVYGLSPDEIHVSRARLGEDAGILGAAFLPVQALAP